MITKKDLQELIQKENQTTLIAIDSLAGKVDALSAKLGATNMHVSRIDRWVWNVSSLNLDE